MPEPGPGAGGPPCSIASGCSCSSSCCLRLYTRSPFPGLKAFRQPNSATRRLQTVVLEELDLADTPFVLNNPETVALGDDSELGIGSGRLAGAERASLYEQIAPSVTFALEWLASHWMPIAAMIWLAGSVATAVVCARRIRRFQRLLRESRPASQEIQDWVDELAANLGITRSPQVVWIGGRLSPMLWAVGRRRSRLIIPTDLWKGLKEQERSNFDRS